jgi:hypothetical protein
MAVTMKKTVAKDEKPRSLVEIYRCFEGTCYLCLHGRRLRVQAPQKCQFLSNNVAKTWHYNL